MAKIWDPGTYPARAVEAALSETKEGRPQVAVKFALLGHDPETITWFGYFTEKTTESTFKALRTLGWTGTDLSLLSEDVAGAALPEVFLVIENESDTDELGQPRVRSRVRWVNSTQGFSLKAMDAGKAKSFAQQMKGKLLAFDRSSGGGAPANGKPAAKPAPKKAAGPDDEPSPFNEDIPF